MNTEQDQKKAIGVVGFQLGLLAPPLRDQLCGIVDDETVTNLDRMHNAISDLYVYGLLTGAEYDRVRMRLVKKIRADIAKSQAEAKLHKQSEIVAPPFRYLTEGTDPNMIDRLNNDND